MVIWFIIFWMGRKWVFYKEREEIEGYVFMVSKDEVKLECF